MERSEIAIPRPSDHTLPGTGHWFKLIGVTESQVPDNWVIDDPSIMNVIRFPKHRKPVHICHGHALIAYAVGKGRVFAVQRCIPGGQCQPAYSLPGNMARRFPFTIAVETLAWVPNLGDAPALRSVLPDFTKRYRSDFRNGSHWIIDREEFEALAAAIEASGATRVDHPPGLAA